jgi:hypothetical protein
MGTQVHAAENYRRVVGLIQSGAIGPVREVHVWVDQGIEGPRSRRAETLPVPPNLHWDLWLGPSRARPYHLLHEALHVVAELVGLLDEKTARSEIVESAACDAAG